MRAQMLLDVLHGGRTMSMTLLAELSCLSSQFLTRHQSHVTHKGPALRCQTCSLHFPERPLHQTPVPTVDLRLVRLKRSQCLPGKNAFLPAFSFLPKCSNTYTPDPRPKCIDAPVHKFLIVLPSAVNVTTFPAAHIFDTEVSGLVTFAT